MTTTAAAVPSDDPLLLRLRLLEDTVAGRCPRRPARPGGRG